VVKIKDDGEALFRSSSNEPETDPFVPDRKLLRNDLEILAAKVDGVLGFNLVPTVVERTLKDKKGTLQRFVNDAKVAANFRGENLSDMVDHSEIIKAAVFDYLIEAKDRSWHNFLIDKNAKKIWLIDHDYPMWVSWDSGSVILGTAIGEGIVVLSDEIKQSIQNLLMNIDVIVSQDAKPEIRTIAEGIKKRAEKLVATGILV